MSAAPPPPAYFVLGRLATAPAGIAPWEILVGPDIPGARADAVWRSILADPPAKYVEVCKFDLHCPHARIFTGPNPALADSAAYLAEIADQLPAARARAAEARGEFVIAERDRLADGSDPAALAAKRAADLRASEAAKSLRRLEDELARRSRVVAGMAPPDRLLDGTATLPVPSPAPVPDPEPAAKKPAKKSAKKPAP